MDQRIPLLPCNSNRARGQGFRGTGVQREEAGTNAVYYWDEGGTYRNRNGDDY